MDLTTEYLGLALANPLVPGASPLADSVETVRRLEDAGAPAIVMRSLFEEQFLLEAQAAIHHIDMHEGSFGEALSYLPRSQEFEISTDQYIEQIARLKERISIPVIASLNGVTMGGWIDHAKQMEQAGADALEINFYHIPTSPDETGTAVEARIVEIVKAIKAACQLPVAVKLHPFFSSLPNFARELVKAGADGMVLFNRFYQPDIDPVALEARPSLNLSGPEELLLRLRWLAILSAAVPSSYAASGGIHSGVGAVKALMAGAHSVQMVSVLLKNGADHYGVLLAQLKAWLEENEYESVKQLRGSMSIEHTPDAAAYERAGYMKVLQGWKV
jgi:dihydroorotate dehydrogenase (fumarate)